MTVALLNQQHGVGKTTLALHLADIWACQSQRAAVIDADPQGCAFECSEMRAQERLPRYFTDIGLTRIVDWPSHVAALTRSALLTANFVLVPVGWPPFVGVIFVETLWLVNEVNAFRPQLRARVVINRCDVRAVNVREVARALANSNPPMLASSIGQRAAALVDADDRAARIRNGPQHSRRPGDNGARGRS